MVVVLKPALKLVSGRWDVEDHRVAEQLISRMKENGQLLRSAGQYFTAGQYCTLIPHGAHHDDGRQTADAACRSYFYQDLMLPVLLDSLRGGWQANELAPADKTQSDG